MIYWVSSNGGVIGNREGNDLTTVNFMPVGSNYAIYIDDATVSSLNPNNLPGTYTMTNVVAGPVYSVPTATGTLTFTQQSDADQLASAKQARLAYLGNSFAHAILSGFPSSADGTSRTYAIDPTAMGKWTGTLANVNSGMLTANIQVKDISGNKVTLTPIQFKQMAMDGFTYFNNQEQNFWTKEDNVNAVQLANYATLQDAINAVNAVVY